MVETITRPERTDPPYQAYAAIMATFVGGIAVTGAVATKLRRRPPSRGALDLTLLGLATFKAARTLAKAEVTSFIREPFVEGQAIGENDHPVRDGGSGRQRASSSRAHAAWGRGSPLGSSASTCSRRDSGAC